MTTYLSPVSAANAAEDLLGKMLHVLDYRIMPRRDWRTKKLEGWFIQIVDAQTGAPLGIHTHVEEITETA